MRSTVPKLNLVLKNTYVGKTEMELMAFNQDMQFLIGKRVPFEFSNQLIRFLSSNFFQKSIEERYIELAELRKTGQFISVLESNEELSYHFLINAIKSPELIAQMKQNRLGQLFIIPIELESFHDKLTAWLGIPVTAIFSSGMYFFLSPNFFDKTAEQRYEELCRLRLLPDFMSYFEPNYVSYAFLKKSVNYIPLFIEQLKKNRLGQYYLTPWELKRFNQQMEILVGEKLTHHYTDEMSNHLSEGYFDKTAEDKFQELYELRKKANFIKCLARDRIITDKFLRKSMGNSPKLIAQLKENRLGQYYLIPRVLGQFNEQVVRLMAEDVSRAFTDELFKYIQLDFFNKSREQRCTELCQLSTVEDFLECLVKHPAYGRQFLRKAVGEFPHLVEQLAINFQLQNFYLPSRHVRKRKLALGDHYASPAKLNADNPHSDIRQSAVKPEKRGHGIGPSNSLAENKHASSGPSKVFVEYLVNRQGGFFSSPANEAEDELVPRIDSPSQ